MNFDLNELISVVQFNILHDQELKIVDSLESNLSNQFNQDNQFNHQSLQHLLNNIQKVKSTIKNNIKDHCISFEVDNADIYVDRRTALIKN